MRVQALPVFAFAAFASSGMYMYSISAATSLVSLRRPARSSHPGESRLHRPDSGR
jgi:hypothetical protein